MKQKLFALLLALSLLLCGCEIVVYTDPNAPVPFEPTGEGLLVHFIDVGQADCALLEYEGQYLLIDGGNRDDSQLVVTYLQEQGVQELAAVVCSHAHEDHVGGLPSVLAVFPTAAVYAPTRTYSSKVFDDFVYYADQQDLTVTIPQPGDSIPFGDVTVTVLGPVKSYAETNDTSIVLRVEYGNTSFLFTGDMEKEAESDLLDYWDRTWTTDVLKVGHHGSDTSSGYRFIKDVDPAYGVISVGEDNTYGHPHREPLERYRQAGVTLLRTDELGHILAWSDGNEVTFTWQNQSVSPEDVEPGEGQVFIGNVNSKKFHAEGCDSLPSKKNQIVFGSYDEAIAAGYTPCGGCLG